MTGSTKVFLVFGDGFKIGTDIFIGYFRKFVPEILGVNLLHSDIQEFFRVKFLTFFLVFGLNGLEFLEYFFVYEILIFLERIF